MKEDNFTQRHIEDYTGERYINPLTDFGFKRIFGTPFNKDLLIGFLNALFEGSRTITDVSYKNGEHFGHNETERKAVFDVYCTTDSGARIIVEMQNVYQEFFKDRSIYYSAFPIIEQARKGPWNYRLDEVYTIGILNFAFPEDKKKDDRVTRVAKIVDVKTGEVFYEKLTYIYVELEQFNRPLKDCKTLYEKWLFCLRNMSNLLERPAELQGRVFERLFQAAEIAKFDTRERREYEQSSNAYRDIKNGMDTAKREGIKEGIKQGMEKGIKQGMEEGIKQGIREQNLNVARKLKEMGMSLDDIMRATGLSRDDIMKA